MWSGNVASKANALFGVEAKGLMADSVLAC